MIKIKNDLPDNSAEDAASSPVQESSDGVISQQGLEPKVKKTRGPGRAKKAVKSNDEVLQVPLELTPEAPEIPVSVDELPQPAPNYPMDAVVSGPVMVNEPSATAAPDIRWKLLTNRINLMTMLSDGYICDAESSWRYQPDSRALYSGALGFWKGELPAEYLEYLQGTGISAPVILEMRDDFMTYAAAGNDTRIVHPGPVPFSLVGRIVFKDEKTLADYRLKLSREVPDPEDLYAAGFSSAAILEEGAHVWQHRSFPALPVSEFDKFLGALSAMTCSLQTTGTAGGLFSILAAGMYRRLVSISSGMLPADWISPDDFSASPDDVWLISSVVDMLAETSPDKGFDPDEFIGRLRVDAGNGGKAVIVKWCDAASEVLAGRRAVNSFADNKDFIRRAVLLFMIRPTQDMFAKLEYSRMDPGARVHMLASMLVGYYRGLGRSDVRYRMDWRMQYGLVERLLGILTREHKLSGSDIQISVNPKSRYEAELSASLDGFYFAAWNTGLDQDLVSLMAQFRGNDIGVDMKADFLAGELLCERNSTPAASIRIKLLPSTPFGHLVRLFGICGKDYLERFSENPINFLRKNGSELMYGKFALDSSDRLIYAVDQYVDTGDKSEYKAHIAHVFDVIDKSGPII